VIIDVDMSGKIIARDLRLATSRQYEAADTRHLNTRQRAKTETAKEVDNHSGNRQWDTGNRLLASI